MEIEKWQPIVGFEGLYSVSSLGQIRRETTNRGTRAGRILKPVKHRDGYAKIFLYFGVSARMRKTFQIHKLVLEAFVSRKLPGRYQQANHKNGDKLDNRLENLEWVTAKENRLHAINVLGRECAWGLQRPNAVIPDVAKITTLRAQGLLLREICIQTGLSRKVVTNVVNGTHWTVRSNWRRPPSRKSLKNKG